MNLGTVVLGLLNGLTIGLSALLLAEWVLDWHWNWWIAFVLAVTATRCRHSNGARRDQEALA